MSDYCDKILSKHQYGICKGFSTKHLFFGDSKQEARSDDKGHIFCALLTDLSKAFNCLEYERLIVKLIEYDYTED